MFNSWTTSRHFTAAYTNKQNKDFEFVAEPTIVPADFVEVSVNDWKKLNVNLTAYYGSIRGTHSY